MRLSVGVGRKANIDFSFPTILACLLHHVQHMYCIPGSNALSRLHLDGVVSASWTQLGWSSCRFLSC